MLWCSGSRWLHIYRCLRAKSEESKTKSFKKKKNSPRSKSSLEDCKPTRSTPCITLQGSYSSSSELPPRRRPRSATARPPPRRPRPATARHWATIMAKPLWLPAGACHTRGTPCWYSSKASPGTQLVALPQGTKAKKTAADGEASGAATRPTASSRFSFATHSKLMTN